MKHYAGLDCIRGDPHPGNVLALPSGDIAYVDFGNVAEISRANQESLIDAVVHVMNRDYDALADCLADLGRGGVETKHSTGVVFRRTEPA